MKSPSKRMRNEGCRHTLCINSQKCGMSNCVENPFFRSSKYFYKYCIQNSLFEIWKLSNDSNMNYGALFQYTHKCVHF